MESKDSKVQQDFKSKRKEGILLLKISYLILIALIIQLIIDVGLGDKNFWIVFQVILAGFWVWTSITLSKFKLQKTKEFSYYFYLGLVIMLVSILPIVNWIPNSVVLSSVLLYLLGFIEFGGNLFIKNT